MSTRKPSLWIIGGPNGAGKSTVARGLFEALDLSPSASVLNPDAIDHALHQVVPRIAPRLRPPAWMRRPLRPAYTVGLNLLAVVTVEAVVAAAIEQRTDVCAETVMSTPKYLPHVRRAKANGVETGLIFVALPTPEAHVDRVRARVRANGHDVPRDRILQRWERSHQQLTDFAREVDRLLVFANLVGDPVFVAEKRDGVVTLHDRQVLPRVTQALAPLAA